MCKEFGYSTSEFLVSSLHLQAPLSYGFDHTTWAEFVAEVPPSLCCFSMQADAKRNGGRIFELVGRALRESCFSEPSKKS